MGTPTKTGLSYQDSGVDIIAANTLVERIKPLAKRTKIPGSISHIGGFAGLFELDLKDCRKPVLVSSTDGVGTKLKVALNADCHTGIGIDLVAMCVNDILTCGAKPLFFLDYYATGKLDSDQAATVIESIAHGCVMANVSLLGGETAEMPGVYSGTDYDLAGFAVGLVDKDKIVDGSKIQAGDHLIGIAGSGPHANGFSLIRRILKVNQIKLDQVLVDDTGQSFQEWLLQPTPIYVNCVLALLAGCNLHGMAHITGGGMLENIDRLLHKDLWADIDSESWHWPEPFRVLQRLGNVSTAEMLRTFNCGIGYVLILSGSELADCERLLQEMELSYFQLGLIRKKSGQSDVSRIHPG